VAYIYNIKSDNIQKANNGQLFIDGKSKDTQKLSLAPKETRTITFVIRGDTAGTHQVKIGSVIGQFEIIAKQESGSTWWIWLIVAIVIFCAWRFRRYWRRLILRLKSKY
jgi:hypothetical protein